MAVDEVQIEATQLAAAIGRQPGAWAVLYRRYERVIVGCVRNALKRYTGAALDEDVEDIVNTVCLNLVKDDFKKLRTFDAARGYQLSSWFGLIATNTALDALRRRAPSHQSLDTSDPDGRELQLPDHADSPRETLERREQWQALLVAIAALPAGDREFLQLYYDDELEPEEIAARLGISINTVYSRKNKLREKIRRLLPLDGGEGC